jgi:hypothetical protein
MSQHTEPTGLVAEDRTGTMTGLKWMPAWVRGELPSPPMAGVLDFRMVEAEKRRVAFTAFPYVLFYSPIATVHGTDAAHAAGVLQGMCGALHPRGGPVSHRAEVKGQRRVGHHSCDGTHGRGPPHQR